MATRKTTKKKTSNKTTKKKETKKSPITISQDGLSHSGVEIYKTKDKNIEKTSKNEDKEGFVLQNGNITEIAYFDEVVSDSFEHDYEDISSNGSVSFVEVDETRFYKGKKILLKKGYDPKKWDNLNNVLMGFITEQDISEDDVSLKIAGMTKLLDQEKQFTYKKTKISKILKDIVEAAGLKCKIDTAGLKDSKIDYTNVSSSGNADSSSTGSASIDEAVETVIANETTPLGKAKAIDKAFKNHVYYKYYWNCHFSDIEKAWNDAHLNCADGANVLCAMFIAGGLNAVIVHTTGHYIIKVTVDGKTYYTDNAANTGSHTTRAFGSVWKGNTSGSVVGTKIPIK